MNDKDNSKIWKHIEIINQEMGEVKEHMAVNTTDIKWIKCAIRKLDRKQWYFITSILAGLGSVIFLLISLMLSI